MSTTTRSSLLSLLLVAVAVLAACGSAASGGASPSPSSPAASPQPSNAVASPSAPAAAPDVSVQVETTGGMCMDGPCGSTVVISADGSVKQTAPKAKDLGTVSEPTLEALLTEIGQADFDAIKSHPFTDTCPIAYDGQQFIYTFTVGSQVEKIDSCVVVVDPANPLFVAVSAALAEAPVQ